MLRTMYLRTAVRDPLIISIDDKMTTLQRFVGGHIEAVHIKDDLFALVDEDAPRKHLHLNFRIGRTMVIGPALIVKVKDHKFVSLNVNDIQWLVNKFIEMPKPLTTL